MSYTYKLTSDGDKRLKDGNWCLVDGDLALIDRLATNLRTILGEWFLNRNLGLPYFQNFFKKNPNFGVMYSDISDVIRSTDGVLSIRRLSLDYDNQTRTLSVEFEVQATDGVISETLNIEVV